MKNSLVKVVIVTFNGMQWIQKCIDSIISSSIDVEIIIVDNNSADGTRAFLKNNFSNITTIFLNENVGFGQANNIGIKKALEYDFQYLFLVNQDVYIEVDTIKNLVEAHTQNQDYGILSPIQLNGRGLGLDRSFSNYLSSHLCENFISDLYTNKLANRIYSIKFVNAAAWLLSRKCIEIVGGFNPSFFHYGEDDNYIQRVKYHGFKVGVLANTNVCHDRGERKENKYFDDKNLVRKRDMILKLSNPFLNEASIDSEVLNLKLSLLKNLILLKFKKCQLILLNIKSLKSLNKKEILKNKQLGMIVGKTFLS
ncbi:glycosyltransferase [Flavobacterium sp. GSA192]|uniref:glycosyltransferase n=1 Tax=Flavobacterium sp. GSA192 TaxID=2576304 RepID=UPI0011263A10|nr:glycosyltransferase [Flavobacterium sp. GSA192]